MTDLMCYYDKAENVIFVNAQYYIAMDKDLLLKDLKAVVSSIPEPVFAVVDYEGVRFNPTDIERLKQNVPEALKFLKGIVRYGFDDPYFRVKFKAEVLKNEFAQMNIFATKEEALAAIREGKV